jgi:hypothetical protein
MRWLVAALAVAALIWSWEQLVPSGIGCETTAYPVRCRGSVIGNVCHGALVEALPPRNFVVDPATQRVTEQGVSEGSHPRCRVQECGRWECIDEVFVRSANDREFRQLLRPGLSPVDPRWTPSEVYVSVWVWWRVRAQAFAERTLGQLATSIRSRS